jgi:starch-binding outer membrane protein, SusD/RagB family
MKKLKTYFTIKITVLAISCAFVFSSCEDYLDVRPKSEIPVGLHFERESGYADQLAGVYTQMCGTAMYGREMTFGLVEVLSQNYDLHPNNSVYHYASEYNYTETTTVSRIDAIWSNTYNCIANLNVMLDHIDKVDPSVFSANKYYLYKGEALGLRAFLHFDMLRLFAPSYASNPGAPGIPYVKEYAPVITPQTTVSETLDLVISDLTNALSLLSNDSLLLADEPWHHDARRRYFNYFAAEATLARVYHYKGDNENALRHALNIVEEGEKETGSALRWTHFTALETTHDYEVNRTYTTEQIFQLRINNMDDNIKPFFTASAGVNALSPSETKADVIYEVSSQGFGNDYRYGKCFQYDGASRYLSKFWQYEGGPHNNIFPLIRKTEAYYIAAEILKNTDKDRAIELLNLVRARRKLEDYPLSSSLSMEEVQREIFKEYRKEFLAEGQLFYYYKRLNLPQIEGAGLPANDNVYVFPMPDIEVEFGFRQ